MHRTEPAIDEWLYLLGWPPIADFVRFIRTRAIGGQSADERELADVWKRASQRVREIERTEPGIADNIELRPLPASIADAAASAMGSQAVRNAFRHVPHQWRMVELDKLVVTQRMINLSAAGEIAQSLGSLPSLEQLIAVSIGNAARAAPVQITRPSEGTYCFSSTSEGLRFLEVAPLDPAIVSACSAGGHVAQVIGVMVGYGTNLLSAFQVRDRLILVNGNHRAYALKQLGVTHAPILVADVTMQADFDLLAPEHMKRDADSLLRGARPPLLKDCFDPELRRVATLVATQWLLQMTVSLQRNSVPR